MSDFDAAIELAKEREDLRKADLDIGAGAARIERQSELVDRMLRTGARVSDAQALLGTFEQTLMTWQTHRVEIVKRIAYLEGKVAQREGRQAI
jgi:hypothetical protein